MAAKDPLCGHSLCVNSPQYLPPSYYPKYSLASPKMENPRTSICKDLHIPENTPHMLLIP
jgi:hypothetical protein